MTYKDIISVYENKKKIYKKDTYKYISKLLKEIKEIFLFYKSNAK